MVKNIKKQSHFLLKNLKGKNLRLEKYLAQCGVASRKKIKKRIKEGLVTINGVVEYNDGVHIDIENDKVLYEGIEPKKKEFCYYLMYKVAGYLTAMEDANRKTVVELLPDYVDKRCVFPVGRLDKDTEGLLVFTNDGELNQLMTHPDKEMTKTYYVELDREINEEDIKKLEEGVTLDTDYKTLPSKVEFITSKSINLTITEGKFHQVKKMLKAVKNKVIYLKRIRFGNLDLGDMKPGEVREIKKEDIIKNQV